MTKPPGIVRLAPVFDKFLFAAAGDDENGTPFTVLSAIARLDIDPWTEASRLADMPNPMAIIALTSLISTGIGAPRDRIATAERLVVLLPHQVERRSFQAASKAGLEETTSRNALIVSLFAMVALICFLLAAPLFSMATGQVASNPGGERQSAATATFPKTFSRTAQ